MVIQSHQTSLDIFIELIWLYVELICIEEAVTKVLANQNRTIIKEVMVIQSQKWAMSDRTSFPNLLRVLQYPGKRD